MVIDYFFSFQLEKELQSLGQDIGESTSEFIEATQEFTEVKTIELEERFSLFSTHLYGAHIKSSDVFSKMIPQIAVLTEVWYFITYSTNIEN